jgi:hypothetical protein
LCLVYAFKDLEAIAGRHCWLSKGGSTFAFAARCFVLYTALQLGEDVLINSGCLVGNHICIIAACPVTPGLLHVSLEDAGSLFLHNVTQTMLKILVYDYS